ncbi:MAG: hypothetical protein ACI9HK_002592 [Pirellulaceae bacterium]|jgi:hypothetical protein
MPSPLTIDQITPDTPASDVARCLREPAVPGPDAEWWKWANVIEGFQLGVADCLNSIPVFPAPSKQRGIVIVGGGKYLPSVYVTVRVLRHVGCDLPIEIWHFDGEEDQAMFDAISDYDVRFVNASKLASENGFRFLDWNWWRGWQLKSFALLNSEFREVLFLDADCYPNRNPEYLFDWPEYRDLGAVIWPDIVHSTPAISNETCQLFEISPFNERLAESGQLLIDREKSWRSLVLAGFYNQCADICYRYVWGDKDTFPFAWKRTGVPYGRMWPECHCQSDCIFQFDFRGHVIFQHRVADKFRTDNTKFDSTPQWRGKNKYHAGLAHESFCFYVLDELQTLLKHGDAAS